MTLLDSRTFHVHHGQYHTLYANPLGRVFDETLFDPENPDLRAEKVSKGGRQAAWFIDLPIDMQGVLRFYRRGGLVGKVVQQRYAWMGAGNTRSWAEFVVMQYLQSRIPQHVPMPLAAMYQRFGWSYEAAIIVERVPNVQPLATCLEKADPQAVAKAILAMHEVGVWHADLNAYNILVDAFDQIWLIDFDRARRVSMDDKKRQGNLLRLQRSLHKVCGPAGGLWWEELNRAYLQQCPNKR